MCIIQYSHIYHNCNDKFVKYLQDNAITQASKMAFDGFPFSSVWAQSNLGALV